MDSPARRRLDELMRRVFPDPESGAGDVAGEGAPEEGVAAAADREDAPAPLRGVDERRQRLLEPLGDPDRESW